MAKCEHHIDNVAMPAVPGSALVVIEPELVFVAVSKLSSIASDGLRPRPAFRCCSCWAPGGEERRVTICDATTDHQTACPQTVICVVENWLASRSGQFEIAPIMQPRSLVPSLRTGVSSRMDAASMRCPRRCRRLIAACPGSEHMSAADPST